MTNWKGRGKTLPLVIKPLTLLEWLFGVKGRVQITEMSAEPVSGTKQIIDDVLCSPKVL